jgi:hypothetical protein
MDEKRFTLLCCEGHDEENRPLFEKMKTYASREKMLMDLPFQAPDCFAILDNSNDEVYTIGEAILKFKLEMEEI